MRYGQAGLSTLCNCADSVLKRSNMLRPYVIAKCAVSLDGYLDDSNPERLILSNSEDLAVRDEVRAECDAILVGANTVRKDDPSLTVKSAELRSVRRARGLSENPMRVTLTQSAVLPPEARFFAQDGTSKIVYCNGVCEEKLKALLAGVADVRACIPQLTIQAVLADLQQSGVKKLMIEGGSALLSSFLMAKLLDELEISVAPFFVADKFAPRLVKYGQFPFNQDNRMKLLSVKQVSDMVIIRYKLHD